MRSRYLHNLDSVLKIVKARAKAARKTPEPPSPTPGVEAIATPAAISSEQLNRIEAELTALRQAVAAMTESLNRVQATHATNSEAAAAATGAAPGQAAIQQLLKASEQLDAARKMIMLQHDESLTHLRQRLAVAEDFSQAIKSLRDLPLEMSRIARSVNTIANQTRPTSDPTATGRDSRID